MKKKIILSIIAIATLGYGGFSVFTLINRQKITSPAETVDAFITSQSVSIQAKTGGIIKLLPAAEHVKKGQLIAEIETVQAISAEKINAEEAYENAALMYKDGILSQEEYDNKITDISNSQSNKPQKTVKITKIYAPIDGEITLNNIKTGDKISQNQTIASINSKQKEINAHFSVSKQNLIKTGKPVEISIIKYPERKFGGTVTSVEALDDNGLPVKIKINSNITDLNLRNGDSVIIKML